MDALYDTGLLEDIVYGLERTSSDPEAVTFLGAIISVATLREST